MPQRLAGSVSTPTRAVDTNAQWEFLRLVEQLDVREAELLLSARLAAEVERTRTLEPLLYWSALPRRNYDFYQNDANRARLRRVLDFIRPLDRVLEIGCGFGYVAGVLVRDGAVEHYRGIDIEPRYVRAVEEMAAVNGIPRSMLELETRDLFTIDAEFIARSHPTLILVLEVLEHVDDPDRALRVLGDAAPRNTPILFSVPLQHRLETTWGHVAIFGSDRLEDMCTAAGLTVRHVEPIHNAWALVLASHPSASIDRTPPFMRSLRMPANPPTSGNFLPLSHDWPDEVLKTHWIVRATTCLDRSDPNRIACTITGNADTEGSQYGGVRLPIDAPAVMRFEIAFDNPENIEAVFVDGYDSTRERHLRWTWRKPRPETLHESFRTYVLKPARRSGPFQPTGTATPHHVSSVHVFLQIKPGSTAGFRLGRVATIPCRSSTSAIRSNPPA